MPRFQCHDRGANSRRKGAMLQNSLEADERRANGTMPLLLPIEEKYQTRATSTTTTREIASEISQPQGSWPAVLTTVIARTSQRS
jgi:hypothetical protein